MTHGLSRSFPLWKLRDGPHVGWEREWKRREWEIGERRGVLLKQLSCSWILLFNGKLAKLHSNILVWALVRTFFRSHSTLFCLFGHLLCKGPLVLEVQQKRTPLKFLSHIPSFSLSFHSGHFSYLWTSAEVTFKLTLTVGTFGEEYGRGFCCRNHFESFPLCLWLVNHKQLLYVAVTMVISLHKP